MLRRSRTDRVGVGLCGGLGRYFGVDPVIFRVVFAVLALFGGSGVVLYLLGWAAIPDEGTSDAPMDRAVAALRRRRVPFALVAAVALVIAWLVLFSWWAPNSAVPAAIVVGLLVFVLARRPRGDAANAVAGPAPSAGGYWAPDPTLDPAATTPFSGAGSYGSSSVYSVPTPTPPSGELRSWFDESRARSRQRRQRSRPVGVSTLLVAVAAMVVLGLVDAARGIPLAAYFWTLGAVVAAGLLVGLAARRTPWAVTLLLIPALAGLAVFGSSRASAHDGWGDRSWHPTAVTDLRADYRLGFGRSTLDLSALSNVASATTTRIRLGAGQVHLIVARTMPVRVLTDVHMGDVVIDGTHRDDGVNFTRTYDTATYASSAATALTIVVTLSAGEVTIDHTG